MMPCHKNHTFSLKKICLIVSGGRKASTNLLQNFIVLLKFNQTLFQQLWLTFNNMVDSVLKFIIVKEKIMTNKLYLDLSQFLKVYTGKSVPLILFVLPHCKVS